ncbi:MAG: Uma2 family endonuclease [Planctomycetota bacterium]
MPETAEKLMTADEFAVFKGDDDKDYELIQGMLVEMPKPGTRHAQLQARLIIKLGAYLEANPIGEVIGESGYRLTFNPDTVRAPDVAYLSRDQAERASDPGFLAVAPHVAIEINSPNDVMSEVLDKARWWLKQGSAQVWIVDDPTRTVTVYLPDNTARVYGIEDNLTADNAMPGFTLPLTELFI